MNKNDFSDETSQILLRHLTQGFCLIEKINQGESESDYRYVTVNPFFEKLSGLQNVEGKNLSEIIPATEISTLKVYDRVLETGEAITFEDYAIELGIVLEIKVFPAGPPKQLTVLYKDITQQKAADYSAILLAFSETLRILNDVAEIKQTAINLLADKLGLSNIYCFYINHDGENWVHQIKADYRRDPAQLRFLEKFVLKDFGNQRFDELAKGDIIAVSDIKTLPGLTDAQRESYREVGIAASLYISFFSNGKYKAGVGAHFDKPHVWTAGEINLINEIATRTWIATERVVAENALRLSEKRNSIQKEAFQSAINGKPLATSLSILTQIVKQQLGEDIRTAFYLVYPDGKSLHAINGAGDMSEAYLDLVDRFPVGDDSFCSGYAIATGRAAFTRNVFDEPLWQPYLHLALEHNFLSCSSYPISTCDGAVIGSLALYFKDEHVADEEELIVAEAITQAAAIILSQHNEAVNRARAEKALREIEDKYRTQLENEVSKRANELQDNNRLFKTIFNTTQIGMAVFKPVYDKDNLITDFEIIVVNKGIEETSGRKDLPGKMYAQVFPGIKKMGLFEVMVRAVKTAEPANMQYHYNFDDVDGWFSTLFLLNDDMLVCTNIDITEQKQTEDERFKNYMLLQQSEDLALLGNWDFDVLTGVFSWSDGMYRLFDLEKEQAIAPEIYLQYVTGESHAAAKRVVEHIRLGDADFEDTIELLVNDQIKVVHLKANVVKNDKGQPARVLGVDLDITALRAAEEKIRKMESDQHQQIVKVTLNTLEEERRRMSESLHNGIGQLLYSIKLSLSGLDQALGWQQYDQTKSYTDNLITEAIKETRRISHELMPGTLEDFGLAAAIDDLRFQLQEGVKFTCKVTGLPDQLEKYMELAIYRTLQELMINVVKHAEATVSTAEVNIVKDEIIIKVTDNGRGINATKKSKPGIGLASIRSKVKLLNGTVNIVSQPGMGTSVEVIIPRPGL